MSTSQVSPYSVPDLKSTTDDALPNYLTSLKFVQDHTNTDIRLAVGYVAVIIGGALFYADWKLGWDATKPYTLPAVVVYFILNGIFTYWLWYVERGAVFVGSRDGVKISISSSTPSKYDPTYHLTVRTRKSPSSPETETKISAPMTCWFTSDGFFVAKPLQQWLASTIEAIGAADPTNVVAAITKANEMDNTAKLEEELQPAAAVASEPQSVGLGNISDVLQYVEASGTGAETAPAPASSKKGRRRG